MIVGLAAGTFSIFGTFLILSATFAGIGLLIRRSFGLKTLNVDDCFLAFWVGYGLIILLLIFWNFVLPVGFLALLFVLAIGGAGIVWTGGTLTRIFAWEPWRPNLLHLALLLLGGLWVANQSMAGFQSWDGALYHLQSVKWAKAYPVVPGIANLHGPLAFNNSSFLYCAMLDSGWWEGRAFHVANGLLVFVMVLQAIVGGARFARGGCRANGSRLYNFLLLAPALYLVHDGDVSSYSSDVPLTLMLLAATARMYQLLDVSSTQPATTEDAYGVFALSILFAAAVCIKMTAGVFAAVAMPLAAFLWWKRGPRQESGLARTLVWATFATVAFAVAWMARGVVMSGYPLFPLSVAGFPVDWRTPAEHAEAEVANIAFTEREFSWTIGKAWLGNIILGDPYAVFIPFCLAVSALIALCLFKVPRSKGQGTRRATWWLLLPVLVAIGMWLGSAPATRYGAALFWTLAAVCVCECQRAIWPSLVRPGRRWAIVGLAVIGLSPPLVEPALRAIRKGDSAILAILKNNVITPGPDHWFHPIAEQSDVTTFVTRSGLMLNVPKKPATSSILAKPWNAPIPCTPNPAPNLRLRQSERLEKGFRVEDGWQMQDWPYYWRDSFLSDWRMRRFGTGVAH